MDRARHAELGRDQRGLQRMPVLIQEGVGLQRHQPRAARRRGSSDGSSFPQSDDGFLYSRAAVVAVGREAYESVFGHPERFAPFTARRGEELLYVHEAAFEQVTGLEWDRPTRYDYESCSNKDGWPELRD